MKRLPIKAAKEVAAKYRQRQVIMVTWDRQDRLVHVVSYGSDYYDCVVAASFANKIKRTLGFPPELCEDKPFRQRKFDSLHVQTYQVKLKDCARCGQHPHELEFRPFAKPCGQYTHWSLCPNTGEPILCKLRPVKVAKKIQYNIPLKGKGRVTRKDTP